MSKRRLSDLVRVLRSKNAGPFLTTIDAFFKSEEEFVLARDSGSITKKAVADALGVPETSIITLMFYEPALGLKITMIKPPNEASGDQGCPDTFGAQQYVPLRDLAVG